MDAWMILDAFHGCSWVMLDVFCFCQVFVYSNGDQQGATHTDSKSI